MIDANSQFFAILTNVGMAKQANADALGLPWKFAEMGVGDANNTDPIPSATQANLINEWRRRPLNQVRVDPVNPAVIIAEQIIPADEGGHWIREIGLYDADGDLVAVANCAPSFKPVLSQGSGRTQVVRMNFIVSSTGNITLKIDPAVVLATREFVERRIMEELYKLDSKQSVRVATTANIALAGLQTLDTIVLVAGDRVLVKSQTVAKDNGLYLAAAGVWARALDADTSTEVTSALLVSVEQGATLADTRWQLVTDGVIVLGATALTFQNVTQGFAPINSPAFLGLPTALTPALFDNSKKLATTEFVNFSGGNHSSIGSLNANVTLTAASTFGMGYLLNSVTPFTVTLPLGSTGPNGGVVNFTNVSTAAVTIKLPATNYIAGMAGVGDGGSFVLKSLDTIKLSTAGGTAWYAEDGSVRDVQSSAVLDLIAERVSKFGLGISGNAQPLIADFSGDILPGLYRAYSSGHAQASVGAPPNTGDTSMSVLASGGFVNAGYKNFIAIINSTGATRIFVGSKTVIGAQPLWSEITQTLHLPFRGTMVYKTAGVFAWAVPDGVKKAWVTVIGGGGGGGRSGTSGQGSGGGGGGGLSQRLVDLTGVTSVTVTVGAVAAGASVAGDSGEIGGASSFGTYLSATGGAGGMGNSPVGSPNGPGNGGLGSGGDFNSGLGIGHVSYGVVGGSGGGPGGRCTQGNYPGNGGGGPGGGGSGAYFGYNGGPGAVGNVIIQW